MSPVIDEYGDVLIELTTQPGLRPVALDPHDALRRSGEVLAEALGVIRGMAARLQENVEAMPVRPSTVEVSFGIKLDAQIGAIIAKSGVEAALNVKLIWDSGQAVGEH